MRADAVRIPTISHGFPQLPYLHLETLRLGFALLEEFGKRVLREKFGALSEHCEKAALQERGDLVRLMPSLELLRDVCKTLRNLSCGTGRLARRIERKGSV